MGSRGYFPRKNWPTPNCSSFGFSSHPDLKKLKKAPVHRVCQAINGPRLVLAHNEAPIYLNNDGYCHAFIFSSQGDWRIKKCYSLGMVNFFHGSWLIQPILPLIRPYRNVPNWHKRRWIMICFYFFKSEWPRDYKMPQFADGQFFPW